MATTSIAMSATNVHPTPDDGHSGGAPADGVAFTLNEWHVVAAAAPAARHSRINAVAACRIEQSNVCASQMINIICQLRPMDQKFERRSFAWPAAFTITFYGMSAVFAVIEYGLYHDRPVCTAARHPAHLDEDVAFPYWTSDGLGIALDVGVVGIFMWYGLVRFWPRLVRRPWLAVVSFAAITLAAAIAIRIAQCGAPVDQTCQPYDQWLRHDISALETMSIVGCLVSGAATAYIGTRHA